MIMRYYRGKPMKDYKPKHVCTSVRAFCRWLEQSHINLRVIGGVAYDADGDRRIILKLKNNENN